MLNPATLRLVLFVSCAHALVHIYELSLPSVEQELTAEFTASQESDNRQEGTVNSSKQNDQKKMSGLLGSCWRLPWGFGALVAGWLVDRFGSHRMLAIYLVGCAVTCAMVAMVQTVPLLFVSMFSMGAFASIYHPAGLALISHSTTSENRSYALGIHGIFGSVGIGGAPLLAGAVLSWGMAWREYYVILAVPGLLFGILFAAKRRRDYDKVVENPSANFEEACQVDWACYFVLTFVAMLCGILYSAFLHFLPRYLTNMEWTGASLFEAGRFKFFAGAILLVGCFGQYLSGSIARARILEKQLACIVLLQVPCLLGMGLATGPWRLLAASCFAFIHFMNQPIYNSLVAKYTPRRRRSLSYGFSFAAGLGVGGLGTAVAGTVQSDLLFYGGLACICLLAAGLCGILVRWSGVKQE